MLRTLLALAVLVPLASEVHAGQVVLKATGTLASNPPSSGPFAGQPANAPVTLQFEVNVPGTPQSPSWINYAIDLPTFSFTVGSASTGTSASAATCGMRNNDPGVDGIWMNPIALVGGGNLDFTFSSASMLMFNSSNPLTNLGTWTGGNFYSVYSFSVMGPGMFIDVDFQTFSISEPTIGTPACFGDGSGTPCPCGNASIPGEKLGCVGSIGLAGKLRAIGQPTVGADTVVLRSTQVPNGPGLYFQGTAYQAAGAGVSFGDGLLCVGGTLTRLGVVFASGNASDYPGGTTPAPISIGGSCLPGDVRIYQLWYRDGVTFCSPDTYNLTNALEITWQ